MSLDQITIRAANPEDAIAIAQVHDEAWLLAYRGLIPGVALARMVQRRGPRWWKRLIVQSGNVLVLDWGGQIAGYVTLGVNRSHSLRVRGEVYELYIAPAYQGLGFGRRLFCAAQRRLKAAKLGHYVVWVLEDNENAVAFYRAMGGEVVAHGVERFDDRDVRKLAFIWGGGDGTEAIRKTTNNSARRERP